MNNWQDAIRHCIRVNNIAIGRFNRWLADAERDRDAERQEIAKVRILERQLANDDLKGILEDYGAGE